MAGSSNGDGHEMGFSGSQPRRESVLGTLADRPVQLLDAREDPEVEFLTLGVPQHVGGALDGEGVVHPVDEPIGSGAAELGFELVLENPASLLLGMLDDVAGGADLVGSDELLVGQGVLGRGP